MYYNNIANIQDNSPNWRPLISHVSHELNWLILTMSSNRSDSTSLQALLEKYHNDCLNWNLCEKKGVVSYEYLLTIKGTKYSTFQEAERAAGLSKSDDFINEVLDDAASVINITEKKRQK
ncbi:hypothetical protein TNCV_3054391 [Trichonephila clavipes]|nr:hypothetical protein TNCV_3054391 [Trichonephila clavipes]